MKILRWRDWSLGAKSAAAIVVPLGLLLFALVLSYRLQQGINVADADVRRALAIQADIQHLHSLVAEAATGVRGFLLTGRDDFLDPYRLARQDLPGTLDSLRRNIRDPEMKQRLARIEHLLDRKLQSHELLRQAGRSMSAPELQAHLLGGKGILDELRQEIQEMDAREAELVAQYSVQARQALHRNLWVDGAISLLVLISGALAFFLLFGGVVRRVQRLAVNAERLIRGEPLPALPPARDEIGQLAERLQNASLLLAQRAVEAQSANQAKTQFLSRTSHELRTPLNAILGFAQLLERDMQGTSCAPQVAQILKAGRHLLALIDEVLDIARIESGHLKMSLEPQGLAGLLAETLELMQPLADQHGVNLQRLAVSGDLAVLADRQRLRQVLLNLISNAIKYNRPGGEVSIRVTPTADQVRIMVRDDGPGIAAELLPRLFSPFDRLNAENGSVEGVGLGLALSRQLILRMGGDIEVQSAPGKGSVFTAVIDRARRASDALLAAPAGWAAAGRAPTETSLQALVIEDNASNLALMEALFLRRPRWRMTATRDGQAGLQEARKLGPALILLDLHLSGLSGEQVLASLRSDPELARIPVVMISADALPETVARLRAAGAMDYLTKPLDVSRFLDLLDRIAP